MQNKINDEHEDAQGAEKEATMLSKRRSHVAKKVLYLCERYRFFYLKFLFESDSFSQNYGSYKQ